MRIFELAHDKKHIDFLKIFIMKIKQSFRENYNHAGPGLRNEE